jgi:hypothetical protein
MLEFSDKAKIAMADGLINYIRNHEGITGISDEIDPEWHDGKRFIHIDYEGVEEYLVPEEAICDAIGAACKADDVDFGVD